jgi:hypothetical protein
MVNERAWREKGLTLPDGPEPSRPLNFEIPHFDPGAWVGRRQMSRGDIYDAPYLNIAGIMLDPRDWKVIFQVYAREPTSALALAYQLIALKQFLQRGPKGIPNALTGLNQAIESLYPHTDFHKMACRLYYRTIESTITCEQEDLITALKKSLHQPKRKAMVKADNAAKHKPQISLVKPVEKAKAVKKRKAS